MLPYRVSLVRGERRNRIHLRRRGPYRSPRNPESVTDAEWGGYLFYRKNPKGDHLEQWCHASGCRRWFNVRRDTVTYEIKEVYGVGETPAGGER